MAKEAIECEDSSEGPIVVCIMPRLLVHCIAGESLSLLFAVRWCPLLSGFDFCLLCQSTHSEDNYQNTSLWDVWMKV